MSETIAQAIINGVLIGGFYALIGMGQNMIFGVMKIINFCQGDLLMLGMYLTYALNVGLGLDPYVSFPIVAIVMFGIGALIQNGLITPSLKSGSSSNLLFLTVGLSMLLQNFALIFFKSDYHSIQTSYSTKTIDFFGQTVSFPKLISLGALLIISATLFVILKYTKLGRQIRATSQNAVGAQVTGIKTKWIYAATYGIGAAIAGIAGSLLMTFLYVFPTVGATYGTKGYIVVVLGGLGSVPGAFFAGIGLGLLETVGSLLVGPSFKDSVVFFSFIVILVVRQYIVKFREG
ncbi:MAG: branched-chain amino acid ABC transporter permease [Oscillospiraceae bacterium]